MFLESDCTFCGECLEQCPFLELSLEEAQDEIERMVQTRESGELSGDCAGCSYCDVICPTGANPSHLRREILQRKTREEGTPGLGLITDEVACNLMSIGLDFETEEKQGDLESYLNPAPSKEVFYLGCSLSHIFTDLAKTRLLEGLPKVGGMKFCCGGYVYRGFGEEEAGIKGRQLLEQLKKTGIEKLITFCPGCDRMLSDVYPRLIPEFDIEVVTIVRYLLDRHRQGEIEFTHPIDRRVTFHDSCAWRMMDPEVREDPRTLLKLMGAEVVEMKHNRSESICCGAPLSASNPQRASAVTGKRVSEAKDTGADTIVVSCTGCFALSAEAEEQGLDVYNITELAQLAIGEEPPHRTREINSQVMGNVVKRISENPAILTERYVIRDGKVRRP